jgi:hypothetical protein
MTSSGDFVTFDQRSKANAGFERAFSQDKPSKVRGVLSSETASQSAGLGEVKVLRHRAKAAN